MLNFARKCSVCYMCCVCTYCRIFYWTVCMVPIWNTATLLYTTYFIIWGDWLRKLHINLV